VGNLDIQISQISQSTYVSGS